MFSILVIIIGYKTLPLLLSVIIISKGKEVLYARVEL